MKSWPPEVSSDRRLYRTAELSRRAYFCVVRSVTANCWAVWKTA